MPLAFSRAEVGLFGAQSALLRSGHFTGFSPVRAPTIPDAITDTGNHPAIGSNVFDFTNQSALFLNFLDPARPARWDAPGHGSSRADSVFQGRQGRGERRSCRQVLLPVKIYPTKHGETSRSY